MNSDKNFFKNGSKWFKADFHLHTKADQEFIYEENDNDFIGAYINRLVEEDIKIGLIANHNKFNLEEYKALIKRGGKENIWLVPGVELSVQDGSNGIHTLIAFDYETWIKNDENFIGQFLTSAFEGVSNRLNANALCKYNLSDLFEKLNKHRKEGRDSFVIMAHVEKNNGFLKGLDGGRISDFAKDNLFKQNVFGFQKVRSYDLKINLEKWFPNKETIPAYLEGSDCKNLDEIGTFGKQKDNDKKTYIKIGDFNFEALKYALKDKKNRVREDNPPEVSNSYIKSISFEGGLLDDKEIDFSSELNNFIGIRGSGKSSVIEVLRYILGISLEDIAADKDYKNNLIEHTLKSGGKIVVYIRNRHNKEYRIEKIYGEKENIYDKDNSRIEAGLETVLKKPVYFGQKDLSNKNIDFEADLVKKLIGNRLESIEVGIKEKRVEIYDITIELKRLEELDEAKRETEQNIKDAEEKLKIFKESGIEDKLKKESGINSDITKINEILDRLSDFDKSLKELCGNYEPFFQDAFFNSEYNKEVFETAEKIFNNIKAEFNNIIEANKNIEQFITEFKTVEESLKNKKDTLTEEFSATKREINIPNINPDNFLKLNTRIENFKLKLKEIEKSEAKREGYITSLSDKISELNELWLQRYRNIENEVKCINSYENPISISLEYKGRRDLFLDKLKQTFKGSGITGYSYEKIKEEYKDFIEIYRDKSRLQTILSNNQFVKFDEIFENKLFELITFNVETLFTINYNNKPLKDHSLGQRATALILFLLAQKETDILIIDQPEDDLDNQTIYKDVIKKIRELKGKMQFIFATHNPNIPVLGDSEKIISCGYSESKINLQEGSIDNFEMQKKIIKIMEGGEEAFNRRKDIYEKWSVKR
ncbi:MAG: AAA family ATPase [Deltaproteobacteria bacterium]|nr:AAA family ATPase [Deltaproteobacteria bacterium]